MDDFNIIVGTDSYKATQWKQYPPKTSKVYSYLESRGGKFPTVTFFGLQYFIKKYLEGVVVTEEKIVEAREIFKDHFGDETIFNEEGWRYIITEHDGKLPVRIKAVAEGTIVPTSNVLMTVENTDPKCFWLTNYLETLLVQVWYPCTVATQSRAIKDIIMGYLIETGDPELIDFLLHCFGYRGVSSHESAGIGSLAHLVNFKGTDTLAAVMLAKKYYHERMAGYSVVASEHSTMTSWGEKNEEAAYRNLLQQYPNAMIISCVSDSYDIFNACKNIWGGTLKDEVINMKGKLVIRPDSGDPQDTVLRVIKILDEAFGHTTNGKGYKVLNHVSILQGDGVDLETIALILESLKVNGYSTNNVVFGMGGAGLQKLDRDTQSFAFKCSSITVDGVERDVFKRPVGDAGKASKAGRLTLVLDDSYNNLTTIKKESSVCGEHIAPDDCNDCPECDHTDYLQTVFENGILVKEYTLEEIRQKSLEG